ncbi:MAG: sulfatase [Verrucomicrobiota bacterium]
MKLRFFLVFLLAACAPLRAAIAPNIVMIVSDDHHWADYAFMGSKDVRTPNLDKLAARSVVFERGYVPSSLCCPSLATIVSGLYPHQHKVTSNDPPLPKDGTAKKQFNKSKEFQDGREVMNRHMEAVATLPKLLGQNGYVTFQTGKWWQGHFSRGGFTHGMTKGFRHGDDGLEIGRTTMQPIYDFIAEAQKDKKPFMVWYAPMLPHTPHNPPDRLLAKYKGKASESVTKYWAMVEWFDETCGQLLDHLEAKGLRENTLVVYVADNGWITDPEASKYAPRSKQSQYEGGVRTPILVSWPGKAPPQRSPHFASSIDLAPTLLKAAGIAKPAAMQGIDLLDAAALKGRTAVFGECFTHNSMDLNRPAASLRWRYIVEGDWKLIVPAPQNEPNAPIELYNVKADPDEKKNLAAQEKDRVAKLSAKLDGWWAGK